MNEEGKGKSEDINFGAHDNNAESGDSCLELRLHSHLVPIKGVTRKAWHTCTHCATLPLENFVLGQIFLSLLPS